MREAAPAVEQAGDRVREERAAGHRAGHDFGALHELGRQEIDQVLREAPDGRRMAKQLVRVEIHAAVVAVAVVEMAVDHQDLGLLQVLQRFLANLRFVYPLELPSSSTVLHLMLHLSP